jgi:hypothetical protein
MTKLRLVFLIAFDICLFFMTNIGFAQSVPAPWGATVKVSYKKAALDGVLPIATYTFTFTNVSGVSNAKPPILGLRCDYHNAPLLRMKNPSDWWSPYSNNVAERSNFDCEAVFGRRLPSTTNDPRWAQTFGDPSSPENGDPMSGTWHLLDPKHYKTSNGWRVEEIHPCGEGTCGSVLYYLNFLPANAGSEDVFLPIPAGKSFEFSVDLDDKDLNFLLTNYLIKDESASDFRGSVYRAYPITKADTIPPVITAALTLTPPKPNDNINFVRVQLAASAKDNFDAGPEWTASSVLRTDKPTAVGDVSRSADMVENQWLLKVPTGETRTYTVNVKAEDATGNIATKAVPITIKGATLAAQKTTTQCTFFGLFCSPVVVK